MNEILLVCWIVQAGVGATLLAGWIRAGRHGPARTVLSHAASSVLGLALWVGFVVSGAVLWAWLAIAAITIGNTLGDRLLVARHRRMQGGTARGDYGRAVTQVLRGRMPWRVTLHALFAGVVFFGSIAAAIVATIA